MFKLLRFAPFTASALVLPLLGVPLAAHAQRFDPIKAAPSLGKFPTPDGAYTINTSDTTIITNQNPKSPGPKLPKKVTLGPLLTGPNGYLKIGTVRNGCAIFAWDSITVGSKQHFYATGSRPLVFLSKTTVGIETGGTISVAGQNATAVTAAKGATYLSVGGAGGAGGASGGNGESQPTKPGFPTGGKGMGGAKFDGLASGGGGYGGKGGSGAGAMGTGPAFVVGTGGTMYGSASSNTLQGGSGGGGTAFAGGGGGGGALEISAAGTITINGTGSMNIPPFAALSAAGGRGNRGSGYSANGVLSHSASGGGSGGIIYLCGNKVTLSGTTETILSAGGGYADIAEFPTGRYRGGPGGGGRIVIEQSSNVAPPNLLANNPWVQPGENTFPPVSPIPGGFGTVFYGPLSPALP